MKKSIFIFLLFSSFARGQGFNHQWLLGSYLFYPDPKGRILFDTNNYNLVNENRDMVFNGTEGNISDANGNFLMSSNGVWIANANNDTMINGSGLNPSPFTTNWHYGQVITYGNIFIPFPGDSSKYILFHQTGDSLNNVPSTELYYSVINMNVAGGLGGVDTLLKNVILFHDTISWGLSACKHANGRDWWIVAIKDNSDLIYKILVTPSGITNIATQHLGIAPSPGAVMQLTFSQDGTMFICSLTNGGTIVEDFVRLLDFDRCSGMFSNPRVIDVADGGIGWGLAFSATGNYVYACSSVHIFQIDVNSLTVDTVATYDGYISPPTQTCCPTTFWNMYLAANGKIYITSGSGVQHVHEMNYPDSAGIACDVQQHAINLGYAQLRAVPNHPNYYLGCDSTSGCPCLTTGLINLSQKDFRFLIYPNPVTDGFLNIGYLLPQNESGAFQIYDITGKVVFKYTLPQWSNEQIFLLPKLSDGVYNCVITSGMERVNKKLAIINQ
ncbi:MAG: T9SS type A sorting domain-containing protein [Bacteroidota bacterium]